MTSRTKSKTQKSETNNKPTKQKYFDTKVFFIDNHFSADNQDDKEIITLRNPSTEKPSKYIYAKNSSKFYEVLSFSEEHRSWFTNETVYPHGNIYITSAFDPLFWALYYIRLNNADMCQPIDQAITDIEFPKAILIADVLSVDQLSMIADRKGDASLKAFKYNESKALTWLTIKCRKLADSLKKSGFHIGAKSMNYIKSEKFEDENQHDGEYLSYAFGILSEYLVLDLCEKLSHQLGLEKAQPVQAGKRKSLMELEHKTLKRIKSEEEISMGGAEPTIKLSPIAPEKKKSAKEMKMVKAASGTKSISSFFFKK